MQRALEMSMREMLSVNDGSAGAAATAGAESKSEADEVSVCCCVCGSWPFVLQIGLNVQ